MKIQVDYVAQFKDAAGRASEAIVLPEGAGVRDLLRAVAAAHPERLAGLLLDESGSLRPSALVFVGDEQAEWDEAPPLRDGVTVTLMAPLAGG